MPKTELELLAEKYAFHGERLARKACGPTTVALPEVTGALHCFRLADFLRARAAQSGGNDEQ